MLKYNCSINNIKGEYVGIMGGNLKSILKTSLILMLGVVVIYSFFRFLPVILILGIAIYSFFKIRGRIRTWKEEKQQGNVIDDREEETFNQKYDFTNKEVVDVEYSEVEK